MHETLPLLQDTLFPPIRRRKLTALQANLGYKCNQSCLHCHVNAGPKRKEVMGRGTIDLLLKVLQHTTATTLDMTGGAPELNPSFRYLVENARLLGAHVIDRCNLTILSEPGQEDLATTVNRRRPSLKSRLAMARSSPSRSSAKIATPPTMKPLS